MHLRILVLVFGMILLSQNVKADVKLSLGPILELAIRFVLLNLQRMESINLGDISLAIPEDIKNISTGTIDLNNVQIYGFGGLDITEISAKDMGTSAESNKIDLCVKLLIDRLGFSSNYDADIGIINEIPIYGDGEVNLAVSKVNFDLCLSLMIKEDFSQLYVDNLAVNLEFRDSPSYITKFWKNENVSEMVTAVINILEKLVCMLLTYEKECVSCVISPIIQYVANSVLPNDLDNALEIKCDCLKNLFGQEHHNLLQELLSSYRNGNVTHVFKSPNNVEHVKRLFEIINENILDAIRNEGLDLEV